jgi:protein gp37
MADHSAIEWTEATWNPVTGCDEVSPGCAHCLAPDTPVLMADMSWQPIGSLIPGDEVVGFTESPDLGQNRIYEQSTVVHAWTTTAEAVEITVGNRAIVASVDHRFLAHARPYWREAERLTLQTRLIDVGIPIWSPDIDSEPYLVGYLAGAVAGDGTFRIAGSGKNGSKQSYLRVAVLATDQPILDRVAEGLARIGCTDVVIRPFDGGSGLNNDAGGRAAMSKIETRRKANLVAVRDACLPERDDPTWKAGFLAGLFDTDGSYSAGNLRFHQTKENGVLDATHRHIGELGFVSQREDFRSAAGRSERLVGNVEEKARFLSTIEPALMRKTTDLFGRRFPAKRATKVEGIRRVGVRDLVDIQTSSGTFIAAGLATHNCYAKTFAERFRGVPRHPYEQGFDLRLWPERLDQPMRWKRPRMVFVNSMSDLFHERIPEEFIRDVFAAMQLADHHTFQILTKRHERLAELAPTLPWPENVWMGVSIENRRFVHRADYLRTVDAAVRFISAEPLLGPLEGLDLTDIHWLIAGGESGPRHRPMRIEWVHELRDRCSEEGVAFFFKQWGGRHPKSGGRLLDGTTWDEMPGQPALIPA